MIGCWVTWSADVLVWPHVTDITPNLNRAADDLRWNRDVADVAYDYTPGARQVTFHLFIRWVITEVPAKIFAQRALRDCLPPAGLGVGRDVPGWAVARLQFSWWPESFRW